MSKFLSHPITVGDIVFAFIAVLLMLVALAIILEIRDRRWKKRIGYRDSIRNPVYGTKHRPGS